MVSEIENKSHSKLSPSASKRWMSCPGSIKLKEQLIASGAIPANGGSSKFAAKGTVAHEIHELCLLKNLDANDYLGKKFKADGFEFKVNKNMADAVQESLDYIRQQVSDAEFDDMRVEVLAEVKASLTSLKVPGLNGGTSDVVLLYWAFSEDGVEYLHSIEIVDYKHGAGVPVDAVDNTQALQYALGVILDKRFKDESLPGGIRITISQPRAFHAEGPIRFWDIDKDYLLNWMDDELLPAAKATMNDELILVASEDACRFCRCAPCSKQYDMIQQSAVAEFTEEGASLPDVNTLTAEQKAVVMENIPMIRSFLVSVENQIKLEVDNGSKDYEGRFKLVRKTTRRKFIDDALDEFSPLLDHLSEDDLVETKPRSMTAIEKDLKKATDPKTAKRIMDEITIKPIGDLVIAPESDKRHGVEPSITSDFKDLKD